MRDKTVSRVILILLFLGMLPLMVNIHPVYSSATIVVPDDYEKIQWAIGNASEGDTIFVRNGPYYENVVVNKSVSLVGDEDGSRTVIIGDGTDYTIHVTADNVTISGFEIRIPMGYYCVFLDHSSNSVFNRNLVKADDGILVNGGSGNNIAYNRFEGPDYYVVWHGINLAGSDDNVIIGNIVGGLVPVSMSSSHRNYVAFNQIDGLMATTVSLTKADNNSFVGNDIQGGLTTLGFTNSTGNVLYHNNFLAAGGSNWIVIDELSINTTWDNGYPSGGNYWSNYNGIDSYQGPYQNETGSDGIGDTPCTIVANHTDYYPLMNPWNSYTLTIRSSPFGVTFLVDFEYAYSTPWIETYNEGVEIGLVMPENYSVGDTTYFWDQWSDESTNRSRLVIMNSDITLTAYYRRKYQLTITSSPITGIPFTIDGTPQTTPYTEELLEGSYTLEMPQTFYSYSWSHWLEEGDINRTKTANLNTTTTLIAVYELPPAVGGIYIPTNKHELLAPYIGLTILSAVAAATVVYVKKRKRQ